MSQFMGCVCERYVREVLKEVLSDATPLPLPPPPSPSPISISNSCVPFIVAEGLSCQNTAVSLVNPQTYLSFYPSPCTFTPIPCPSFLSRLSPLPSSEFSYGKWPWVASVRRHKPETLVNFPGPELSQHQQKGGGSLAEKAKKHVWMYPASSVRNPRVSLTSWFCDFS